MLRATTLRAFRIEKTSNGDDYESVSFADALQFDEQNDFKRFFFHFSRLVVFLVRFYFIFFSD